MVVPVRLFIQSLGSGPLGEHNNIKARKGLLGLLACTVGSVVSSSLRLRLDGCKTNRQLHFPRGRLDARALAPLAAIVVLASVVKLVVKFR